MYLTAGCFFAFFAFGFIDNLKGPVLPELIRTQGLTLGQGGNVLFGAYMGFILATLVTGIAADAIGNRRILFLAGVCMSVGLAGISLIESVPMLVLMMFVMGLGLGAIEVGANGLIIELHPGNSGRFLNLLATFHGSGSLLVPLVVAWQLNANVGWRSVFLSAVVLSAPLAIAFAFASGRISGKKSLNVEFDWRKMLRIGFAGDMVWYCLLICTYVAVELGVAAWLMEYLQTVRSQSTSESSYYLSGFFAMIMVGRFLGSFVVERLGYLRVVSVALLGGGICLVIGILGPNAWVVAMPISGLFFSIVFPTVAAHVTSMHKENNGLILGLLFTFGGIGGALGPWAVGMVGQRLGLEWGLFSTVGFCVIAFATVVFLLVKRKGVA